MMRKACVEPIEFNPDGSITEVEMTSQGAGPPLNATAKIDAERACLLHGNVRIAAVASANEALMKIRDEDAACYKYIDFGEGIREVSIRVRPGKDSGRIDLVLDWPWKASICTVEVPGSDQSKDWINLKAPLSNASGVRELWLRFSGDGKDLFNVDWLQFQ